MKKITLFIFIFSRYIFYGQGNIPVFNFADSTVHLYAIGENHAEKNTELQFEIVKYLQKEAHLRTIIMEVPVEVGDVLNQIVLTGENRELVVELFQDYPHQAKKDGVLFMDSLISLNRTLPEQDKIEISGIDLVYYPDHHFIISTLRIVFPELKNCTIPLVQQELFSKKKPKLKRKQSLIVLKQLLEDISENKELYQASLGERMKSYEELLYNTVHYKELKEWDPQDAFREGILTKKLISSMDTNSVSLLICGRSHLARKNNDYELHWESSFKPMIANAYTIYHNSIFTIITHYYKEKKWLSRWIFGDINLLNDSMDTYFDKKRTKYRVFTTEELKQHPKANSRCDMIIIQNNKFKKRNKR